MQSYQTTTDRILTIRWSGRGTVIRRQSAWGGQMHAWSAQRLNSNVYIDRVTNMKTATTEDKIRYVIHFVKKQ